MDENGHMDEDMMTRAFNAFFVWQTDNSDGNKFGFYDWVGARTNS